MLLIFVSTLIIALAWLETEFVFFHFSDLLDLTCGVNFERKNEWMNELNEWMELDVLI